MDFNKKIAHKILLDLESTRNQNISFENLKNNIEKNLLAVDSTFPNYLRDICEGILSKIKEHQEKQYAATLNTPMEGTYDKTLTVGNLFDSEIHQFKKYNKS